MLILPLKPRWAELILDGKKAIELRSRASPDSLSHRVAAVYATRPESSLVGVVRTEHVHVEDVRTLWSRFGKRSCVPRADFDAYFQGKQRGYAIELVTPARLPKPIPLADLRDLIPGFHPPMMYSVLPEGDARRAQLEDLLRPLYDDRN